MKFLPAIFCFGYISYLVITEPLLIQRMGIGSCTGKSLLVVLILALYLTLEPLFLKRGRQIGKQKGDKNQSSTKVYPAVNFEDESNKAQSIITDLKLALKKVEEERDAINEALKIARAKLDNTKKEHTTSERDRQIDAEIVNFLGLLQESGRIFDFLMNDITTYSDTQVGVAARVVHQGLSSLVHKYFEVVPVHSGQEGDRIKINAAQSENGYHLIGRVTDAAENTGDVVHRGWRTKKITLPRVIALEQSLAGKGVIAPALVEIS